jgi:peptide/nickel transport system permease protein
MDTALAFPGIIFALAILAALGPGLMNVTLAIAFTMIPRNNRIVRASVLSEKQNLYIDAARVVGCTENNVMWRHILPNVTAPIIIIAATELGTAILLEATLSFLGVGVPPPQPTWGGMLSGPHRTYMLIAPWMAIFPGLAIMVAVLGWNLLGDALRDIWDPRLRTQ